MGESIFEEEDEPAGSEDEEEAPAEEPAPPTSTTSVNGPSSTSTTWGPRLEPLRNGVEAEGQEEQAAVEGEVTSAREAPRLVRYHEQGVRDVHDGRTHLLPRTPDQAEQGRHLRTPRQVHEGRPQEVRHGVRQAAVDPHGDHNGAGCG